MSGSDASVGAGGGAGADDCPTQFQTVLGTPDPAVVSDIEAGDILDIVKYDEGAVRAVVAVTIESGARVGAITRDIARLRRCIDEGVQYEGEVLSVAGGSVTIDVRRR